MNAPIERYSTLKHRDLMVLSRSQASGADWAVFLVISMLINDIVAPPRAWCKVPHIADATGRSESTVKRSISKLATLGVLTVHRTRTGNEYHRSLCLCSKCCK